MTDRHIATLRLPGIGRLPQWRDDGFRRELDDARHRAERDGAHRPAEDDRVRWTGIRRPQARGPFYRRAG